MSSSPPLCIEWSSACFWWRNVCLMGRVIYCQRRCSGAHTVIQWARKTCNSDWNKNLLREAGEQKKSRGGMLGVLKVWILQQNKFESDPSTQCRVAWPCPVKRRCDITSPFWWLKRVSTIYASPLWVKLKITKLLPHHRHLASWEKQPTVTFFSLFGRHAKTHKALSYKIFDPLPQDKIVNTKKLFTRFHCGLRHLRKYISHRIEGQEKSHKFVFCAIFTKRYFCWIQF